MSSCFGDVEMSIVVRTLSERVFDVVREQIIMGKLRTDTPIRQDALAAELGVSKIPVREALARLEQEGLLTSHPNRGYLVRPMSTDEARSDGRSGGKECVSPCRTRWSPYHEKKTM